ncbi:MAG: acyl-CoA dehydrogenase family protein [Chloroflexi bacterium]|nr:acyl-CoA dehydrogenase family protein [Chloroflexota bacterium]MDA1146272.1 acyl-CoA dehydrogenase family protein [Chloroflexota bacterium]
MDWNDTPEQAAFRSEVVGLIDNGLPEAYQHGEGEWVQDRKSSDTTKRGAAEAWQAALADKGWIAPHWPKEYGGAGLTPIEQFIFKQEMAQAGAPAVGGQGVSQLGPTIIVHGTDEQKAEHLPKILSGEVNWQQGYSEPGSGSDLASLQTRAVRDGDDYVINGQKIWTSGAQYADWLYVLTRTDPEAPKHRGISFMLMPMGLPGLSIRPLIDMGGHYHFNETFFEDVRVPAGNVVGEVNRGWYVGATLLDFERSNITGAITSRKTIQKLIDYVHTDEGQQRSRLDESVSLRHQIADRWVESEVQFQFSFRIISMQSAGQIPNYEASTSKLFNSELSQKLARTGTQVFGQYAQFWGHDDDDRNTYSDPPNAYAPLNGSFTQSYVRSVPATIAAGTSEIQRNIIATRGLGLPRG